MADDLVAVRISGRAWGAIEGGGLLQTERPWIADAMTMAKVGFGRRYTGVLGREDAEALLVTLQSYGDLFSDRGAFDRDDELTHREGLACTRDAARLRETLERKG
jgi:hypothetical protein